MSRILFSGRGHARGVGPHQALAVYQLSLVAVLLSGPAGAEPCPPKILVEPGMTLIGDSQQCTAPSKRVSDTPDYQDPLAGCAGLSSRRTVSVSTATALQHAMTNASCGDTIQLAPGAYDGTFSISKSCPATSPVIIKGAPNFQSTVTSNFTLDGQRTILTGISFVGPSARVFLGGTNNKVLANKFRDWRTYAVTMRTGNQGEIAFNDFSDPHPWLASETGVPMRMGIRTSEKDPSTFHFDAWVHQNHFHDFPQKPDPDVYASGQSDAIEVCETGRVSTSSMLTGWYIESNLIQRHLQGHGIIDLKCGGNVVRYNTVIDSPGGRIDVRNGSNNVLESNWIENSGGSTIHGGHTKVVGNNIRGGGLTLIAGDYEWNVANTGHSRAYKTLVAGNITNALRIGRAYTEPPQYPVLDTVVEAHSGSTPQRDFESNTTIKGATEVKFSPASKLTSDEVGPAAMSRAPASYLVCRRP